VRKYYSLYGRLLATKPLLEAFRAVRRANGAGGVDGQTIDSFGNHLEDEITKILTELKGKEYVPLPVRRVEIPKNDGSGEKRKLGIPTVRDRVVQQAVKEILEPIFEKDFHSSSYAYRKGRNCHHAISEAQKLIRDDNLDWVVDMDLSKCFDTLDHELIIDQLKEKVTDGSILNLVRGFLKSGVMINGKHEDTEVGSPQGGVISPLLSNIYLNNFDQFMKSRGHRIVRYADDILIFSGSQKSAQNAQRVAEEYLVNELKLTINQEKTHVVNAVHGVKFLGVKIFTKYTLIQPQKLENFKKKVKELTKKSGGRNLVSVIRGLNRVLIGFINYYRIANCKKEMNNLMSWIRRRLRAIQMFQWKRPARLHRRLRQLGYYRKFERIAMRCWRNSASKQASFAMPNKWFHDELKLYDMSKVETVFTISVI
jgi:group II intron reverse transcriptase/maturase